MKKSEVYMIWKKYIRTSIHPIKLRICYLAFIIQPNKSYVIKFTGASAATSLIRHMTSSKH